MCQLTNPCLLSESIQKPWYQALLYNGPLLSSGFFSKDDINSLMSGIRFSCELLMSMKDKGRALGVKFQQPKTFSPSFLPFSLLRKANKHLKSVTRGSWYFIHLNVCTKEKTNEERRRMKGQWINCFNGVTAWPTTPSRRNSGIPWIGIWLLERTKLAHPAQSEELLGCNAHWVSRTGSTDLCLYSRKYTALKKLSQITLRLVYH